MSVRPVSRAGAVRRLPARAARRRPTCPAAARRWAAGTTRPAWRCGASWPGSASPRWRCRSATAGSAPAWLDVVIACEELGHHALPGPVAESLAAVPVLLAALADGAPDAPRWLPRPGRRGPDRHPGPAAGLPYAADADAAGLVLLAEDGAVWLATAGTRHRSVDPARSLSQVAAAARCWPGARGGRGGRRGRCERGHAGLRGPAARRGPRPARGQRAARRAADPVRPADRVVPGGQAPARRRGDRAGVRPAAARRGRRRASPTAGPPPRRDVSAAKVACTDAAHRAARAALQVHGAIGYTQEHDLHLWLTKVRALAGAWGSQAEHRARVMAATAPMGQPGMELTDEQRDLRDAVRGLLAAAAARRRRATTGRCGGGCAARSAWRGSRCRERYGGAGAGPVEIHIVMEELGRAPDSGRRCSARRCWPPRRCWLPATPPPASGCCPRSAPTARRSRPWPGPARRATGIPAEAACRATARTRRRRLAADRRGALRAGRRRWPTCCWSPRGRRTGSACSRWTRAARRHPCAP